MNDHLSGVQLPSSHGHEYEISSSERRWVLVYALLVMLATSVPYLIGFANQGTTWRFTGFVFGVEDGNSYIAKMLSGAKGAWLFRSPYTAEEQGGVIAFLPFNLLGRLASPPGMHEQLVALFHLFRFFAGIVEIIATYQFLALFITSLSIRRVGLVLSTLGGGLGWLLVLFGQDQWLGSLPLEFYSPETFGFLGLYGLPHLALARAGLLWALLIYLRSLGSPGKSKLSDSIRIGLVWLLVYFAQPLTTLVVGFVFGLHWVSLAVWQGWRMIRFRDANWYLGNKALRLVGLACVLPAPFIFYNFLTFSTDPFLKRWTAQNLITSPHPMHYLLAYGIMVPFAVIGGIKLLRLRAWQGWLLAGWALAIPLLAYAPVNLQRRLPEGVWVALVILAMKAFDYPVAEVPKRLLGATPVLLLVCLPSSLFLLVGGILTASRPGLPLFRPVDEVKAFEFLAVEGEVGDVVLASYQTGNALPAWAPVRVVIGLGPESIGLSELQPRVERFYASQTSDEERRGLLQDYQVSYVFRGPVESSFGIWLPAQVEYLHPVYQSKGYEVYRVVGK